MNTGERRRMIVLCSVAGFLVVVLIAKFTIFNGGGSGNTAATLPLPPSTEQTSDTSAPSARSTRTPETFDVFATKNPFEPVIIVTPGDTTPTTPSDTTPVSPGDTTAPTTPGDTTAPTNPPSNEPAPGTSVALLDVYQLPDGTPMAKVQVGSTVYTVGVGDVFAVSYRVVSLNAPCGQFLFGDAPFKLCEGEEVIK
jgi:hypothetical protein